MELMNKCAHEREVLVACVYEAYVDCQAACDCGICILLYEENIIGAGLRLDVLGVRLVKK